MSGQTVLQVRSKKLDFSGEELSCLRFVLERFGEWKSAKGGKRFEVFEKLHSKALLYLFEELDGILTEG